MALLLITTLFLALLLRVSWGYLRTRDPLLRDVMMVFASVAPVFGQAVTEVFGGTLPQVALGVLVALLLAQPVSTLWLVSRLRPVPLWAAVAGWLFSAVPVVLIYPFPDWMFEPGIIEYVVVEMAAAWLLAREARRRGGAARNRLWCAAAGTALFGIAILLTLFGPTVVPPSQGILVVSALIYVLAFAPPEGLRRAWSRNAAYGLTRRLLEAPAHEPPERAWQLYCEWACEVAGTDGAIVLQGAAPGTVAAIARAGLIADGEHHFDDGEIDLLLGPPTSGDLRGARTTTPPAAAALAAGTGARFVTAAPLTVDGRRGALVLLNRYRTLFTDDDIALFAELAAQAATMASRAGPSSCSCARGSTTRGRGWPWPGSARTARSSPPRSASRHWRPTGGSSSPRPSATSPNASRPRPSGSGWPPRPTATPRSAGCSTPAGWRASVSSPVGWRTTSTTSSR